MTDRPSRIEKVVSHLRAQLAAGLAFDRAAVEAEHSDLMPELGESLDKLEEEAVGSPQKQSASARPPFSSDASGFLIPANDISSQLPLQIEGYEFLGRIGRGGMGEVYKARQMAAAGRIVAIKILRDEQFASDGQRRRFEREVEIASELHHPNIAELYDSGLARGRHFFAMQYIDGLPLDQYCRDRKLSIDDRLNLFGKICTAMAYAHQRGVIHRDLKPSNLLVDAGGEPHILDFGLAKLTGDGDDPGVSLLTLAGAVMGTLPYMAPEQAAGHAKAIDTRTDVYALGVILYELLTESYPYEVVGQMASVLHNIANATPKRPSTINRRIGNEVETIILRALAKEPDRRYGSAAELGKDIGRFLNGEAIEARPPSLVYRMRKLAYRHRRLLVPAFIVLVLMVSGFLPPTIQWVVPAVIAVATVIVVTVLSFLRVRAERNAALAARDEATRESEARRRVLYSHQIALADAELRDANITRVRQLLELCPDDLRGWEWDRLQYASNDAVQVVHTNTKPWFMIWHSQRPQIATLGELGRSRLVDLPSMELRSGPFEIDRDAGNVVVSDDWSTVIITHTTETGRSTSSTTATHPITHRKVVIRISCLAAGVADEEISKTGRMQGISLSPDAKRLAYILDTNDAPGGRQFIIRDLAARSESVLKILDEYNSQLIWLDEQRMLMVNSLGTIRMVDLNMIDHPIWEFDDPRIAISREDGIRITPDHTRFAYGRMDGSIAIHDVATGGRQLSIGGDGATVTTLAFDPTGARLGVGNSHRVTRVWDTRNGSPLGQFIGHEAKIEKVRWSPQGDQLASISRDGSLRLWNPDSSRQARTADTGAYVRAIATSTDTRVVATSYGTHGIAIWDAQSLRPLFTTSHDYKVTSLAFLNDDRWLAQVNGFGDLRVWDWRSKSEVLKINEAGINTMGIVFHPAICSIPNRNAVYVQGPNEVRQFDLSAGKLERSLAAGDTRIERIALSPDGALLVVANRDSMSIFDTGDGRLVASSPRDGAPLTGLAFHPNGSIFASGDRSGKIILYDAVSGGAVKTMTERGPVHSSADIGMIEHLAWSPDGRRIATAGWDNMVKLWNPDDGHVLLTLRGHADRVCAVSFSPDGNTIYSGSKDGILKAWDCRSPTSVPGNQSANTQPR